MIHVITSTGISILHKLVKLQIAECWWQIHNIIKIEQKPYRHTYIQAHSADIQLVSGIAVLHPQFGDAATSIQSTYMVSSGHWICTEEEIPRQIKTVKQYSALRSPFFTQNKVAHPHLHMQRHAQHSHTHTPYDPSPTWPWLNHKTREEEGDKGIPWIA